MDWKTRSANGRHKVAAISRRWRQTACAIFCIWSHWSAVSSTASSIVRWSNHLCESRVIYPVLIAGCATSSWRRLRRPQSRQRRIRMSEARLWLAGITVLPALVIAASYFRIEVERLRRLAVASAAIMLLATFVIAVSPQLRTLSIRTTALSLLAEGEAIIRIDALPSVLLPFAAGLWLFTVAVTPRAALDRGGLRRA